MNITLTKVKRKLVSKYGWSEPTLRHYGKTFDLVIKDTLSIIDEELKALKGISIKGK